MVFCTLRPATWGEARLAWPHLMMNGSSRRIRKSRRFRENHSRSMTSPCRLGKAKESPWHYSRHRYSGVSAIGDESQYRFSLIDHRRMKGQLVLTPDFNMYLEMH